MDARASAPWTLPALFGVALLAMGAVAMNPGLFMVDDAWFYLQIGRNLALGEGSTFDGESFTNGYHPLWMGLVASVGVLTGGSREAMLYGGLALQVGLAFAALYTLTRAAREAGFAYPAAVTVGVLLTQLTDKGWMSEGLLCAALHGAVLWSWVRADRPARTGLLLGLLFLARLDTVFLIGALVVFAAPDWRRVATLAGVTALVVSPWLLGTLWLTGHVVPVSGAIKSVFPVPDFTDWVGKLGWIGVAASLGSVAGLGLSIRLEGTARRVLAAVALGALCHAVYVTLFTAPRWSTFVAYYWITGVIATGLVAGELLRGYFALLPSIGPAVRPHFAGAVLVGFASAGAIRAVRSVSVAPDDPTIALARWVADALPDAVILAVDGPGRLAWFSGRPVIGADGLTQDYGFAEQVASRGLPAIARERGVTHVMSYSIAYDLPWATISESPLTVRFVAPGRGEPGGELVLGSPVKSLSEFLPEGEEEVGALYVLPSEQ